MERRSNSYGVAIGVVASVMFFLIITWPLRFRLNAPKGINSKVVYIDTRGSAANAEQVWFIFINPGETQVKAYPMKRTGSKQYECSIPGPEIKHDYIAWVYLSDEYLGELPIIFDFTPYVNSALSIQKI